MTKSRRKTPMEPSPSASAFMTVQEFRASFRYRSLLQDYEGLLKVAVAKRKKLQRMKRRKQRLSSEIRFLRRKHRSLSANPFQETLYTIKKQPRKSQVPSASVRHVLLRKFHVPGEVLSEPMTGTANPNTANLLDLNQNDERWRTSISKKA